MPEPSRFTPDRQSYFVAESAETPLELAERLDESVPPQSLWRDAWVNLRKRPTFIIAAILIVLIVIVAIFPSWFTSINPYSGAACDLANARKGSEPGHPFGFDAQGCDIYSRVIYGARASVSVGFLTTIGVVLIGGTIGALAGYFGGWLDALLSRIGDIFFAIPLVLAAIVMMQSLRGKATVWSLVLVLAVFGWPQIARITRGAVISVRNADFITASTAVGASRLKILLRHVVPNSLAPVIVTATVSLGTYIVLEATLSFLGIGLPPGQIMSWGSDIARARSSFKLAPEVLFYPAGALAITVLSFIMLGDAVRDALDPKARKR